MRLTLRPIGLRACGRIAARSGNGFVRFIVGLTVLEPRRGRGSVQNS